MSTFNEFYERKYGKSETAEVETPETPILVNESQESGEAKYNETPVTKPSIKGRKKK